MAFEGEPEDGSGEGVEIRVADQGCCSSCSGPAGHTPVRRWCAPPSTLGSPESPALSPIPKTPPSSCASICSRTPDSADWVIGWPHSEQKSAPGRFSVPQLLHVSGLDLTAHSLSRTHPGESRWRGSGDASVGPPETHGQKRFFPWFVHPGDCRDVHDGPAFLSNQMRLQRGSSSCSRQDRDCDHMRSNPQFAGDTRDGNVSTSVQIRCWLAS